MRYQTPYAHSSNDASKKQSATIEDRRRLFASSSSNSDAKYQSSSVRDLRKNFSSPSSNSNSNSSLKYQSSSVRDLQKNFSSPASPTSNGYAKNQKTFSSSYSNGYAKSQPSSKVQPQRKSFSSPYSSGYAGFLDRGKNDNLDDSISNLSASELPHPSRETGMFEFYNQKAEVEILDSHEDDQLAASVYGGAPTTATKKTSNKMRGRPKMERQVSGYNFDELLKSEDEEETESSLSTLTDSIHSARRE